MFQQYDDIDGGFDEQYDQQQIDYDSNYANLQNERQFRNTEVPRLNTQVQVDRYKTLMDYDADTKNIPKTFGNNFKKFMDNQIAKHKDYFPQKEIPKEMLAFLNKKKTGQQADYTIQDFRELFYNKTSSAWFQFYIENVAFLDLINSNRIDDPEKYIKFIEQYLAGAKHPLNFISSRPIKESKQEKKKVKKEDRIIEVQQLQQKEFYEDSINEGNLQNDEQRSHFDDSDQQARHIQESAQYLWDGHY